MSSDLRFAARLGLRFGLAAALVATATSAIAQAEDFYDGPTYTPDYPMEPVMQAPAPTPTPAPAPTPTPTPSPTFVPNIHEALPGIAPVFVPQITPGPGPGRAAPLDTVTANAVAGSITSAGRFCQALPAEYRIDCMGDRLEEIAKSMPRGEGNDEVRAILNDASDKLERIARQNRDRAKPRIRASTPPKPQAEAPTAIATSRPIIAVRSETEAAATAEAAAVLEEAGALLLRSAAQSQAHSVHYQTVAQALESSALLLRS